MKMLSSFFALLGGILLSGILGLLFKELFYIVLIGNSILLIGLFVLYVKSKEPSLILLIVIFVVMGFAIRTWTSYTLYVTIVNYPHIYYRVAKNPMGSVALGLSVPESYIFEMVLRNHLNNTRKISGPGIDVYSGKELMSSRASEYYSIGPDLLDDSLLIAYDPTNGVFSRGDIAIMTASDRNTDGSNATLFLYE